MVLSLMLGLLVTSAHPAPMQSSWCSRPADTATEGWETVADARILPVREGQMRAATRLLRSASARALSEDRAEALADGTRTPRSTHYYLVRAGMHASASSTRPEQLELFMAAYKLVEWNRETGELRLHVAQMWRGDANTFNLPVVIATSREVRRASLLCHTAE